ncbi:MAG: two-component system response regulator CreB [Methylophilaceae bacterium 17-44-8]|jgi:two-component system catabolic regulation response regulator CreB|nr:MAG: two-component system response regulator CreB [Methylophilales bacterium 28-44-11]OYZ06029.1 MAG: two-component system response regulator CreB [Methylophilales bacterium 16-45-7]OZA04492.1 MAG: two-component system response regulator CreB [Methylophilaceae bacterium 17-44-8]
MTQRILVIEDEPSIAETTTYALNTDGFETVWASTGQHAIDILQEQSFDLAVLDVGLPDINGFEVFRQINHLLPVIFLTARSGEIDRIVGLELGADDYIAKPFSPRELCARIRTVLRRVQKQHAQSQETPPLSHPRKQNNFFIDEERKCIQYLGVMLELSRTEYRLLKVLCERPGRVFTREELMNQAWEHPDVSLERTVDAHIKLIRAKLRIVNAETDPILTHRGLGYSLKE